MTVGVSPAGEWYENAVRNGLIPAAGSERSDLPPEMPEASFQFELIRFARSLGWKVAHFRRVRVQRKNGETYWETPVAADGTGFPDLLLIRENRCVVAELKAAAGRVRPEQAAWLAAFAAAGIPAYVWKPRDWPEIRRTLGRGPRPSSPSGPVAPG
jgi:hypothetical protein